MGGHCGPAALAARYTAEVSRLISCMMPWLLPKPVSLAVQLQSVNAGSTSPAQQVTFNSESRVDPHPHQSKHVFGLRASNSPCESFFPSFFRTNLFSDIFHSCFRLFPWFCVSESS